MGERIKALRKARGMTQTELSRLTGIHRVSIAKYEMGKNEPGLKSLVKLCKVLGVPVETLLQEGG